MMWVLAIWLLALPDGVSVTLETATEPDITIRGGWATLAECQVANRENVWVFRGRDERAIARCIEQAQAGS